MINLTKQNTEHTTVTTKLIVDEALSRGWQISTPYIGSPILMITTQTNTYTIYSSSPQTTSYIAAMIANDKLATHELLNQHAIPLLDTVAVEETDITEALSLQQASPVIVKPLDAAHGNGITTNVNSAEDMVKAISYAVSFNKNSKLVIVQKKYIDPVDLRVLCINYKVVAASVREPATVTGDGISSIRALIEKENISSRGEAYKSNLAIINMERALQYLGDKINTIPKNEERVVVSGTANIGSGGESIAVTDDLPNWLSEMAEKIARIINLPVCGVDFMIQQYPQKDMDINILNPIVTEVNKSPSFGLHQYPNRGKAVDVAKIYLNYLSTL